MKIDPQLIYLLLFAIFLVFFGGKILGGLLQMLVQNIFKNRSKKNQDIDELIKKQELKFKTMMNLPTKLNDVSKQESSLKLKGSTLSLYQKESNNSQSKLTKIKNIMGLFDSLQWGEGPQINQIIKRVEHYSSIRVDHSVIVKTIKLFISTDFWVKNNPTPLYDYDQIEKSIISYCCLDILAQECLNKDPHYLTKLSKISNVDWIVVKKSFESLILSSIGGKFPQKDDPLKLFNQNELLDLYKSMISSPDKKGYFSMDYFHIKIEKEVAFYKCIELIPPLKNKNDKEGAFRILDLKKNANIEDLKARYKKLAKERHPDSFSSKKISDEMMKIINQNFSQIQESYELLKELLEVHTD